MRKTCVLQITKDGIFQKTGHIKWRFVKWGIIGGSKVKLYISDYEDAKMYFENIRLNEKTTGYIPLPFGTLAVHFITTPFFITILLLLISACLFILPRVKSQRKN